jgi:hypothetical protein
MLSSVATRVVQLLGIIAALSGCASEPWDTTDRVLGAATLGLMVTDWGQARYIARHPAQYEENNPILGAHPSTAKVDAYFVCAIGGGYLLADNLESRYRKLFLGGAAAIEIHAIHNNYSIGVRVGF